MKALNKTTDPKKYLQFGELTKPFLSDEELALELKLIEKKLKRKKQYYAPEYCIIELLHTKLKSAGDDPVLGRKRFSRTAAEIYKSGKVVGCTDYAYLFASLARQMGIPTTVLQTSQKEWANKFINGFGDTKTHSGHFFCECCINGRWVLVDPTIGIVTKKYDSDNKLIHLSYKVGNSTKFLPYERGLDIGEKMTVKAYCDKEENAVMVMYRKMYQTSEVKKRFNKIKTPEELKTFMDEMFSYGFIDCLGLEHVETMYGVEAHRVLSVEEMFKYKYETCAEAAKLAKYWFSKNGYECKLFYERIKSHNLDTNEYKNHSTHFYIIFKDEKGVWNRFEQSSLDGAGVYPLGSLQKAKKHIIEDVKITRQNQIDFNKGKNVDFNTYGIYEFADILDGSTYETINKEADKKKSIISKNAFDRN